MRACLLMVAAFVAACNNRNNFNCELDTSCDLSGGGMCIAAPTGNMWCAYPDPSCADGYRFSNEDVGDGVSGECVESTGDDGGVAVSYTLTVRISGSGNGVVSSTPTGLTCSSGTCVQTYTSGAQVMLSQSANTGTFLGWTNDCTGSTACTVTIDRDRTVTALFGTPGEALWSQQLGGTMQDYVRSIAIDGEGNLIVLGEFSGSFMAGTATVTSAGQQDLFVAKLAASDGTIGWIKSLGGNGYEGSGGLALDASNNIYIAGIFTGTTDVGGGPIAATGSVNGFALKLASDGAYQWAKHIAGTSTGPTAISVRGSTVAVAGSYNGSMVINGQTISGTGTNQAYLTTLGADGTPGIVKTFPGTGNSIPTTVLVDHGGNLIVAGTLSGSANFGAGAITSSMSDTFVAKYTSAGTYIIAKVLGGVGNDNGGFVSVDPADNIFMVGHYVGSVSFGGASPLNANNGNLVIAKYSAAGAYQWAQAYGGTTAGIAAGGAAVNSAGDIVIGGSFCGSATFGTSFIASVGTCANNDHDIFAARFAGTNGSALRATRAGGSSQDLGYDVIQASDGRHFIVGGFQGFADFAGTNRTSAGGYDGIVVGLAPL